MFSENKASLSSIRSRKNVYGVGVNDCDYFVLQSREGKTTKCPYYSRWQEMLKRAYCKKYQAKKPTYKGCSVCEQWLSFSNFKEWMKLQDWKGKHLDKDILSYGNKVYGPDNCIFVSKEINALLTTSKAARGKAPIGVSYHKRIKKYGASCGKNGKQIHIGYFDTIKQASEARNRFKYDHVVSVAINQKEPLRGALLVQAEIIISAGVA